MARKVAVVLAVFLALVAITSADVFDENIAAVAPSAAAEAPDSTIGTVDEGDALSPGSAEAAPVGEPVPDGAFSTTAPASAPSNGASALEVSAIAAVVAVAGYFF